MTILRKRSMSYTHTVYTRFCCRTRLTHLRVTLIIEPRPITSKLSTRRTLQSIIYIYYSVIMHTFIIYTHEYNIL